MAGRVSKEKVLYGIVAVLAIALIFVLYSSYVTPGQKAAQREAALGNVKKIYETLTEAPVEVLSVREESGMYRVVMRTMDAAGNQQVQEVLVTQDGALITDRAVSTQALLERLEKEKAFAECLAGKRLAVAGLSNDVNTQAQLQILGSFWRKVYVECSGANLQLCQQAGITQVPTTVYNATPYVGVQSLQFYEQLTGCRM